MSTGVLSQTLSTDSGLAKSYAVSLNPSSDMQEAGGRALLRYPVASQIVIFAPSTIDSKASTRFISIPITEETRLSPRNCHRDQPSRRCTRVVIRSDSKLDVKIYDTRGHDERWNLAVLRSPKHADVGLDLRLIRGADFVTLEFETVEKRVEFTETFEMVSQIIQRRVESYWRDRGAIRTKHVAQ